MGRATLIGLIASVFTLIAGCSVWAQSQRLAQKNNAGACRRVCQDRGYGTGAGSLHCRQWQWMCPPRERNPWLAPTCVKPAASGAASAHCPR